MEIKLYGRRREGIGWKEAWKSFGPHLGGSGVTALVYSRSACRLVGWENGCWVPAEAFPEEGEIFEVRAFSPQGEVRWLRTGAEGGDAVLLSETVPGNDVPGDDCSLRGVTCSCQRYRLWGKVRQSPHETPVMVEERLPPIGVPGNFAGGKALVLLAREYIGALDEFGNQGVLEELLVALEQADGTP